MTVKELREAPSLATLYPKAVTGLRKSGDTLPNLELVRPDVVVGSESAIAAYDRVCGFRVADELPATYPHILAFPMQMALMTRADFPFPLLGMVHVANRITQHRPVLLGEAGTLRVRAENLRPHPQGRQFDMVSEFVPDEADAGPIWTDVSTYLRRGPGGEGKPARENLAQPTANAIWSVPGDLGRQYAAVSGDRNPIHLYALTAKAFGFPRAIAHGMWTKARCLAAFEGRLPHAFTVDVRFRKPVLLPAKVAFTSWRTDDGFAFELWHARKPIPHLAGTITKP